MGFSREGDLGDVAPGAVVGPGAGNFLEASFEGCDFARSDGDLDDDFGAGGPAQLANGFPDLVALGGREICDAGAPVVLDIPGDGGVGFGGPAEPNEDLLVRRMVVDGLNLPAGTGGGDDPFGGEAGVGAGTAQREQRNRPRKNLEGEFGENAEAAEAADEELGDVEAGDVFDDAAACRDEAAVAVNEANRQDKVADAAEAKATGTAESGGDGPAESRARSAVERGEGEELAPVGEGRFDLGGRGSRKRAEGEFSRVVLGDAREAGGVDAGGRRRVGVAELAEARLGARAHREDAIVREHGFLEFGDCRWF